MKINASTVNMNSEHLYSESNSAEHMSLMTRGSGVIGKIEAFSEEHHGSVVAGLRDYIKQEKADEEQQRKENMQNGLRSLLEHIG